MPGLEPLLGHDPIRIRLAEALRRDQLPNSLMLHGAPGIGKQRLALWFGQRVLCTGPAEIEPCGRCTSCRLALRIEHPDLHWFFPLPRPRVSGGSERMGEALEEARAAVLAERRQRPHRPTFTDEPTGVYLAHVQVLRRLAAVRPAMGGRSVFIVGDAELLVPQEASPEAANALLKLLEEPPRDTFIVVTASVPDTLLPTIRSRLLPIGVRPLPLSEVRSFLAARGVAEPDAERIAHLSQGAIGRALGFLPDGPQPGPLEQIRDEARTLVEAAVAADSAARFAAALRQPPAGARGSFAPLLDALALWIRDLAAVANGASDVIVNVDAAEWLRRLAERLPAAAAGAPAALDAVRHAAELAQFNVNPQLTLGWLLGTISRHLKQFPAPVGDG